MPINLTAEEKKLLAEHLRIREYNWAHDLGRGCDTCGYGGGIEIDYEELIADIDKFSAELAIGNPTVQATK